MDDGGHSPIDDCFSLAHRYRVLIDRSTDYGEMKQSMEWNLHPPNIAECVFVALMDSG